MVIESDYEETMRALLEELHPPTRQEARAEGAPVRASVRITDRGRSAFSPTGVLSRGNPLVGNSAGRMAGRDQSSGSELGTRGRDQRAGPEGRTLWSQKVARNRGGRSLQDVSRNERADLADVDVGLEVKLQPRAVAEREDQLAVDVEDASGLDAKVLHL